MAKDRRHDELAAALGRSWAELKAEALRGDILASAWPDGWDPRWAGPLDLGPGPVDEHLRAGALAAATRAAAERWRELVHEQRELEDAADVEHDAEASARNLVRALESDLPAGLRAANDGARAFLYDDEGTERTIDSIEHAWRVVAEYEEHRTLRTS